MTLDSLSQKNANHHWYPFLKYQEECKASGKEATVNDWMRATGKLDDKIAFEKAKEAAAIEKNVASSSKAQDTPKKEDQ